MGIVCHDRSADGDLRVELDPGVDGRVDERGVQVPTTERPRLGCGGILRVPACDGDAVQPGHDHPVNRSTVHAGTIRQTQPPQKPVPHQG